MNKAQRGVRFPETGVSGAFHAQPVRVGERLYTCAEAGEATHTTERFWRGLVDQRRVRYLKLGKFVFVPESAINELLAQGMVEPTQ